MNYGPRDITITCFPVENSSQCVPPLHDQQTETHSRARNKF